jgi:predicted glycoside hydrolase/deacetylase ChbG (UPF0249 family)
MLVINADDWGFSRLATDTALTCHREGRITSVSAMVFMEDSERAADLARVNDVDAGLHVNLTTKISTKGVSVRLRESQERIVRFLAGSRYAQLIYNPGLRRDFHYVYQAQVDEFFRLFGAPPSHFDGHRHMHLCSNMLINPVIPAGQKVRRSFSFWPGEKSVLNRAYRSLVDRRLARRYRLTDFFFSLFQCLKNRQLSRVTELAGIASVELMTHPAVVEEYTFLMSEEWDRTLKPLQAVSYSALL